MNALDLTVCSENLILTLQHTPHNILAQGYGAQACFTTLLNNLKRKL